MRFINLTPDPILLELRDGQRFEVAPGAADSVKAARVKFDTWSCAEGPLHMAGSEIQRAFRLRKAPPVIPPAVDGVVYLASLVTLLHAPCRPDLMAPDTSVAYGLRNEDGRLIGTRRLIAQPQGALVAGAACR